MKMRFISLLLTHGCYFIGTFAKNIFSVVLIIFLISCSNSRQNGNRVNSESKRRDSLNNSAEKREIEQHTADNDLNSVIDAQSSRSNMILMDISGSYSLKKLVIQDIADIEYVALEKKADDLFEGAIAAITEDKIIGYNYKGGDIFIFNRKGQLLNIINHLGNGPKEYSRINGLTYDHIKNEIFVNDMVQRKVNVYDVNGNFRRYFHVINGRVYHAIEYFNNSLLCCDTRVDHPTTFFIISPDNGAKITDLQIPYLKKFTSTFYFKQKDGQTLVVQYPYKQNIVDKNEVIFNEISSDTIFKLTAEKELKPFVIRKPSLSQQNPQEFLLVTAETDQFIFFKSVKNEFDPTSDNGFFTREYLYDKEDNKTYLFDMQNSDDESDDKLEIKSPVSPGISVKRLDAYKLVEAHGKGRLKGKLKEIASILTENDNPVLMIMEFKE